MLRQLRIDYPGTIHHVMSRGDRRENIYHDDVDRQDFLKTLAEACQKTDWQVAEELKRLKWTEPDLMRRRKSDPGKLRIAARLRRETILSLKRIASRVGLGSAKSANAQLHGWMQTDGPPNTANAKTKETNGRKRNQTKA